MPNVQNDSWVRDAFGIDPGAYPDTGKRISGPAAAPGAAPAVEHAGSGQTVEAIGPTDVLDILKIVAGPRTAAVIIRNQTGQTLTLAGSEIPFGDFSSPPPTKIAPNAKEDFAAKNSTVLGLATSGVEGTVKYALDDQGNTVALHFDNPLFKKNNADARLSGGSADKTYAATAFAAPGNDATFKFTIDTIGPQPKPDPKPDPAKDANASCLITITNTTKSVLTLAHQGHDYGDFMSFPSAKLQPGGSTNCVSTHTPDAKDGQQGCKGFLTWEAATADGGTAVTWRCDWANPVGEKNTASATLDPQSAGFASLEQIGQGDENVPVAFTLSGGGGGPVIAGGTSSEISVSNATQYVMRLTSQSHSQGDFASPPAKEIPPNGVANCADAGDKGCAGTLVYALFDQGGDQGGAPGGAAAPAATVTLTWNNPPGDSNAASGGVDPQGSGVQLSTAGGAGDDKVAFSFFVSGGQSPQPQPPPGQEPAFDPPAGKTRQPTLRKGDQSADGWVEYAQELLGLPTSGKFDDTMEQAVLAYQGAQQPPLQPDGVIGNQTWASLRKGAPEKPSSDGRKPHSFVQEGEQARFFREKYTCGYQQSSDRMFIDVVSVGTDTDIGAETFLCRITAPSGKQHVLKLTIGKPTYPTTDGQGNIHVVTTPDFLKTYGAAEPGATADQFLVEAYLDAKLGGDSFSEAPKIIP